jgi:hypothetical protein
MSSIKRIKMGKDYLFATSLVIIISCAILFLVVLFMQNIESKNKMEICRNRFTMYEDVYVDDISIIEPGYLKCCWRSYLSHEGIISCEVIKIED